MSRHDNRSNIEREADAIDCEIYSLAGRIDRFCEMVSRGKPKMDPDLIEAARSVARARSVVRKYMEAKNRAETVG